MRFKLIALMLGVSCLPAMALPLTQGSMAVVGGRAHVEEGAQGTYIELERRGAPLSVAGFIPFGDEHAYPDLADLDGWPVEIKGVVEWDGQPMITMTDPDQLAVVR